MGKSAIIAGAPQAQVPCIAACRKCRIDLLQSDADCMAARCAVAEANEAHTTENKRQ